MNEDEKKNQGLMFAGAGTAIGTVGAAIIGTTLAAPAAIGAGIGLVVWGVVKLITDSKK
jgi:hypothetical protein